MVERPAGYAWRATDAEDSDQLLRLTRACERVDGAAEDPGDVTRENDSPPPALAAVTVDSEFAAIGRLHLSTHLAHEARATLDIRVHPEHRRRGLGTALLRWAEAEARGRFAGLPPERPRVLRVDLSPPREEAAGWLERRGFRFHHGEHELRRSLAGPLPPPALPAGMRLAGWDAEHAAGFHRAYTAAFRDRPGFPGWSAAEWRAAFVERPEFRAELSWLALDGGEEAGFVVGHVEGAAESATGWIAQVGVAPPRRRRGLGRALVLAALRGFQEAGLGEAALEVNFDNDAARRLYEGMGFRAVGGYAAYCRAVLAERELIPSPSPLVTPGQRSHR